MRAAVDAAEKTGSPAPGLLEVALLSNRLHTSPALMGFDMCDPRIVRTMGILLTIYEAASDRKRSKKASEWDKANPELKKILDRARRGVSGAEPKSVGPGEVTVNIPKRSREL